MFFILVGLILWDSSQVFFILWFLSLVFFILWDSSLVFFILVVFIFVGFIFVGYIFVGFIFVEFIFVGFIFWVSSCGIHPPSRQIARYPLLFAKIFKPWNDHYIYRKHEFLKIEVEELLFGNLSKLLYQRFPNLLGKNTHKSNYEKTILSSL